MQKELNLEIFGEQSPSKNRNLSSRVTSNEKGSEPSFLNLDKQIFDLKSQCAYLTQTVDKLNHSLSESQKNFQIRIEKSQQQIQRLEQNHNGMAQEVTQRLSMVAQKLSERKNLDLKVQEMVDRHNNILKSFEVRLGHLQKLLNEKDMQIVQYQAALNDAKMEIQRLKRF